MLLNVKPGPTVEPQPVIYDPVLNITFPLNLTDPTTIPTHDTDPVVYPVPLANLTSADAEAVVSAALAEVLSIIHDTNSALSNNCSKCIAALSVGQLAARLAPTLLPDALVTLCKTTQWASNTTCQNTYEAGSFGAPWTQILAKADVTGVDGQQICAYLSGTFCPQPAVFSVKATFPKPKPTKIRKPCRSGNRVKVLHMSDLHLDPRYVPGSEANCSSSMCCRPPAPSIGNATAATINYPAPIWGYYKCDSPYYLALAALQSIQPLTNLSASEPPAFTLYTGDLVAHDAQVQRSRAYVENIEVSIWHMFKAYIGGPIYSALGNHDTNPDNLDVPHAIDGNGPLGQQLSWSYDHVSKLWQHYGWIDEAAAKDASLHYGGYAITHPVYPNLRIITLNTDLWYRNNMYTFVNVTDPDFSGIFTFLIDELQQAEDNGQAVWIVGHVLTGWSGTNPMPTSTDFFYQIVERYSPHVIRAIFFGHTHEDQTLIYYNQNGTVQTANNAIAAAWVGPSLTPLTNLNSGYRLYEVDTGTWEIFEAYTFFADVNSFASLEDTGPTFQLEYSTREAYGPAASWPDDAPLNATFWHRVTEAMEKDRSLVTTFNKYQSKSSIRAPPCTTEACAIAKICYIRSGSAALGRQCPQGFDSTQSPYTGKV
ncbi:sphingomyelin phosphodiesterase [Coniochaeta ligniaria NRRL 30616]|uniref:Sphingomyelin phosphodiesterase n=1 Tax=Coniochaeta ligniaria NRRL 30616 TaxID=1408157 RepID=A0A1J7IRF1_9PEZI|nr:sphingomyelin phosphodiesterase [Coniochaeta ligniaria NRRL 30616]